MEVLGGVAYFLTALVIPIGGTIHFIVRKGGVIDSVLSGFLSTALIAASGIASAYALMLYECWDGCLDTSGAGWAAFPHILLAIPVGVVVIIVRLFRYKFGSSSASTSSPAAPVLTDEQIKSLSPFGLRHIFIVVSGVIVVSTIGWWFINDQPPSSPTPINTGLVNVRAAIDQGNTISYREVVLYHYVASNQAYETTTRRVPSTSEDVGITMKLLFATYLPTLEAEYIGVSLDNGVATVNFKQGARAYLDQTSAGISAEYANSIRQTLLQFSKVQTVQFAVDDQVITGWDA